MRLSRAYADFRKHGPFPGRIDPWAEDGRYFQQIHAGMIGHLLSQIQDPLLELGYEAGRETSLQVMERREPDLYVRHEAPQPPSSWDYPSAAAAILAEPGIAVDWTLPSQDAIHVQDTDSGELVTIVEIVSPSNKVDPQLISEYRERRNRIVRKGVNVVEVDPTRSVKHLLQDVLASTYAYHVAVYLPGQSPRVIGSDFGDTLKRIALPLRKEVVAMELQTAYDFAYQQASIAGHIYSEGHYEESFLPFPTLLTEAQRRENLASVQEWIERLRQLRENKS
jgi:hypothetical protein